MSKSKLAGTVLAITAAAAFSVAPTVAMACHHHHTPMVKCLGVNGCKGHSSCKTANNSCKGQNACKNRGFVVMSKKQCGQVLGM